MERSLTAHAFAASALVTSSGSTVSTRSGMRHLLPPRLAVANVLRLHELLDLGLVKPDLAVGQHNAGNLPGPRQSERAPPRVKKEAVDLPMREQLPHACYLQAELLEGWSDLAVFRFVPVWSVLVVVKGV